MAIKFVPKPEPEAVPAIAKTQDREPEKLSPDTIAESAQSKNPSRSRSRKTDKTATEKEDELF